MHDCVQILSGKNSIFKLVNLKVNPDPPVAGKPVTLKADVDVGKRQFKLLIKGLYS